jgi:very-short-patch-repair endonuclease
MVNFRSDYLASVGIQVLRFSNSDILDRPNAVLREIRSACRLRVDPVNDPDD